MPGIRVSLASSSSSCLLFGGVEEGCLYLMEVVPPGSHQAGDALSPGEVFR